MSKEKSGYERALECIEKERHEKTGSLDIGNLGLIEIPAEVFELAHLRNLNLGGTVFQNANVDEEDFIEKWYRHDSPDEELTANSMPAGYVVQSTDLNTISSLTDGIKKLRELRSLYFASTFISDLKPLSELPNLRVLDFQYTRVDTLDDIKNLGLLEEIYLSRCRIRNTRVLANFRNLRIATLYECDLNELEGMRELSCLKFLNLSGSGITNIAALRDLTALRVLSCIKCGISDLSPLKNLIALQLLNCSETQVSDLSPLKNLTALQVLDCSETQVSDLSPLKSLTALRQLDVDDCPLAPEYRSKDNEGPNALLRYLQELNKASRSRYEAKLLILGDGNEGKTCVSRALRGLKFRKQKTTRGVDVVQWPFDHPEHPKDAAKTITLNVWDFEGQEISHQTHQFFLSTEALYLLVFKCRDQFLMERAEYWLDTIRARAPGARVAIVITECEKRTPYVPLDRLQAQYGDLLCGGKWFFAVGCSNDSHIGELREEVQRRAAALPFMGRDWAASYQKAEDAIKAVAKNCPYIGRQKLHAIFKKAVIEEADHDAAAAALATLGIITQFPDCPDLHDFIVLRPQWLTKAISWIMEDEQLSKDHGQISLQRMRKIWERHRYTGMFQTFHNCMKEFELCYDLEDDKDVCLVPLRFGYVKPRILWSAPQDALERRLEYKLNIRPPMGIMSRFIVKTHHMMVKHAMNPQGVYWHNGVFLATGDGPLRSEALCEFDRDERKFRIEVRAAFPQNLAEQIHAYIKAVFSFFEGLEAERSYGCIVVNETTQAEKACKGMHTEKRIYSALLKKRILDCEFELHDVDPARLIGGFASFATDLALITPAVLRQLLNEEPKWAGPLLRGMDSVMQWAVENGTKIADLLKNQSAIAPALHQELELKLHEYLAAMDELLDDREMTAAPGIFSINTKERSGWNPATCFNQRFVMTPFCECPQKIHPCVDGSVEFKKDREWWQKSAPWIAHGTKILSTGLQLAFAGMPLAMGQGAFATITDDVKFMNELARNIRLDAPSATSAFAVEEANVMQGGLVRNLRRVDAETSLMRSAVQRLLEEIAPVQYKAKQWGSLSRLRMSDNSHRWLCADCRKK